QVSRLTRTVRQLLDYCRPAAIQPRELTPTVLIENVLEAIRPELEAAERQLDSHIDPDLPSFCADAGRLELALLNLVRNALQASTSGIGVTADADRQKLTIRITDDGPGLLDEHDLPTLLEPFFTTKSPGEGTGLGLAIVQAVVEEHGGQ